VQVAAHIRDVSSHPEYDVEMPSRAIASALLALCASACGRLHFLPIGADGAGVDGGPTMDAGRRDASPVDAGPLPDVPRRDAPGLDAPQPVDGGPDSTSCDDVHAGALFCDGFEDGETFGAWTMVRNGFYSSSPTYRGSGAMRATSISAGNASYLYKALPMMISSGELFLRGYLYVPAEANPVWVTVLHAEESGNPWDFAEIRLAAGEFEVAARSIDTLFEARGGPIPRDRWVCIELRTLVADAGTMELFVDESSVAAVDGDTRPAAPYRTLYSGISYRGPTQPLGTIEYYLDEVVVDTARIGCD
jgi:hypothetical protein